MSVVQGREIAEPRVFQEGRSMGGGVGQQRKACCARARRSADPLNGCKTGQARWLPVLPALRTQRQVVPGATASQLVSSGLNRESLPQMRREIEAGSIQGKLPTHVCSPILYT